MGAFYGIPPSNDSVKEFVKRQVWYHPKSGLEASALTDEQRETLSTLEKIAKEGLTGPVPDSDQLPR